LFDTKDAAREEGCVGAGGAEFMLPRLLFTLIVILVDTVACAASVMVIPTFHWPATADTPTGSKENNPAEDSVTPGGAFRAAPPLTLFIVPPAVNAYV
jgi:flagellar basal body-associated protein FliL